MIIDLKTGKELDEINFDTALAVGNFDGVHLGHKALLEKTILLAKENNLKSAVWTFSEFTPKIREKYITSPKIRKQLIHDAGIEYLFLFDYEELKDMSGDEFVREILIKKCRAKVACCGFNFRFGKSAGYDSNDLKALMEENGGEGEILPEYKLDGVTVSSTYIRTLISNGQMKDAKKYLGRPFFIRLPVIHGRSIGGKELNAPTINQRFPKNNIIPRKGVYACLVTIDGVKYPSCTNVGVRPSVESDGELNCETHIIEYSGDLYDREIQVEFCEFLRDEKKFNSFDELKNAIFHDIDSVKEYFK